MARYVMLCNWTEQGVRAADKTVERADAARKAFEKAGAKILEVLWTLGPYDLVITAEAPDDETITALGVRLGAMGNVRTCTMRAYDGREIGKILKKT